MKNAAPWLLLVLLAGFGVRMLWPVTIEVPGIPVIVTDTVPAKPEVIIEYVDRVIYRDRVVTDTIPLTHEVVISEPVLIPCPDLPRIRGITHVSAGQGFDDTTRVSLVDLEATGRQIAVQRSIEKLYTPGPLTYLEASEPLRADFGTWAQPDPCGFWCRLTWFGIGAAGGALAWELAR